jgi:signal transduction histidine kinase
MTKPPQKFATFYNPYIAGPPITDPNVFFGRQFDLEKIINLLTGNFVMLIGPRRIGKTSLLHQLVYHLSELKEKTEQFVPVLVNAEGISEVEFFHVIMEEIVDALQKYLPLETIADLSFDLSNPTYSARIFSRDLQVILKNMHATLPKPCRLALLLDEMDRLNSFSIETQSQLRRIFQRFANSNLSVVVAGVRLHQHWAGENSPFYNMFVPVTLTPFSEAEARRLITEPVESIFSYSDEAVARILEVTLGLPHRIQQLCLETIYQRLTTSPERAEIAVEDVNVALSKIDWLDEEIAAQDEFKEIVEFMNVVSHELKVPMTNIKGYATLLQMGASGPLTEQQKQFLVVISNNVDRMARLVNDLLDVSRIESGRIRLEIENIRMRDVINEVVELLQAQIESKRQNVKVEVEDNLPELQADYSRMVQIMTNLISNAHKYTPEGGSITVIARLYKHNLMQGVAVTVKDTGYGIVQEDQAKLFTKFFRSSDQYTRDEPGSGLGLAINKKIIEAHGGELTFESELGQGSSFTFTIPLVSQLPANIQAGQQ